MMFFAPPRARRIRAQLRAGDRGARPRASQGLAALAIEAEVSWFGGARTSLGDASALRGPPTLRSLSLQVDSPQLDRVDAPSVRTLALACPHLTPGDLAALARPGWHGLERLDLELGVDNQHVAGVTADALAPVFAHPGLRMLALRNATGLAQLIARLAGSAVLPRLTSLDLSRGVVDARAVRALEKHAAAFAHLDEIDLSGAVVSNDDLVSRVARIPGVVVDQ